MEYLILVRHGLSTYNKQGLWTGWDDPDLAPEGVAEAKQAASTITDIPIDLGYTSVQKRHKDTLNIIKKDLNKESIPVVENVALNERDYGVYTRKNKWRIKKQLGDEEFQKIRRSWDYPIPEGESLKQVYGRVVRYFESTILPQLKAGKNVIISSSGNALRSLVKYLENISDDDISKLEIATGEVYIYKLDNEGKIINKEIRNQHPNIA
ncbi:MAG: 2,3-diphosphoglycerate-dependent phosphoglycerate mutase [Candidatus Levybacteria bacterium]|nr:2,3-diphosphoglycerate-dependent phosphoglycerate mutase [Candidatus Levybacteria bacterium]